MRQPFEKLMVILVLAISLVGCSLTSQTVNKQELPEEKTSSTLVIKKDDAEDSNTEAENEEEPVQTQESESQSTPVSDSTTTETQKAAASTASTTNSSEQASKPKSETKTTTTPAAKPQTQAKTVTVQIQGPSEVGAIMGETKVSFKDGDTVLDVLLSAAKTKGIHVDYSGSGATAYVSGIDNYYEFDYGPKSGWTWGMNGTTHSKSSDAITVKEGDRITWIYTEDFTGN